MSRVSTVVVVALLVTVAGAPVATAQGDAVPLRVDAATVSPDGTATVPVTVARAPAGVAGFDLTLAVADPGVVQVESASVADPLADVANVSVASDGSTVRLAGLDGSGSVEAGAGEVRLATVTVRGVEAGTTGLRVEAVHTLETDDGEPIPTTRENGTVAVGAGTDTATTTPTATGGDTTTTSGGSGPGFTALAALAVALAAGAVTGRR